MKLLHFNDDISSSFKSMKLANGNHDSIVLPCLRARRGCLGGEMMTCSSSIASSSSSSSSSSSLISMKSPPVRPSRDAKALSWLVRRSAEDIEWSQIVIGGIRDDDATEATVVDSSNEILWNSGMNEKCDDDTMGGKTGGPSHPVLGTSGGAALGTGFGDGIDRNDPRDTLREVD